MREFALTALIALLALPELLHTLWSAPASANALLHLLLWLVLLAWSVERRALSEHLLKSSLALAVVARLLLLHTLNHLALVLCLLAPVRASARLTLALGALSWLPVVNLVSLKLDLPLPNLLRLLFLVPGFLLCHLSSTEEPME